MILTGNEIINNYKKNKIFLNPFTVEHVNPNSYELRLGNYVYMYKNKILDTRKQNEVIKIEIPKEGLILKKNKFYLGFSSEEIGSDYFVPILHCKSGIARMGLFIHITADLIDIGFKGNLTFQLFPTHNIKVYPGMKIAQLSFWKPKGKIFLYKGKYMNSKGPTPSKNHLNKN